MTGLSRMLAVACAVLAATVVYLGRERVTSAGPHNRWTRIHNPWTGTVLVCGQGDGDCEQVYPPIAGK